jgi:hypothetical protein
MSLLDCFYRAVFRKEYVSETGFLSVLRWKGGGDTELGPTERNDEPFSE